MTNKMILAVVPRDQAEATLKALVKAGYTATFCESRGGVLRQSQQMLFIAVAQEDVERVLTIIQTKCASQPSTKAVQTSPSFYPALTPMIKSNGVVIFVWDLDRLEVY